MSPQLRVELHPPGLELPTATHDALARAVETLARAFGDFRPPLRIQVGGGSSGLHIAYSPDHDAVLLPDRPGVVDHGLHALDHLRHELFHAAVGRHLPQLVTPEALGDEQTKAIHEGAADYFAATLDDNGDFGDGYFADGRVVRRYRNHLRYPLVAGSHARGNALTSHLLARSLPLAELAAAFLDGTLELTELVAPLDRADFGLDPERAPRVEVRLGSRRPSSLGRLRVVNGEVLTVTPNSIALEQLGELEVRPTDDQGAPLRAYRLAPLDSPGPERRFRLHALTDKASEKVILNLHAGERRVGFLVLYLSPRRTS